MSLYSNRNGADESRGVKKTLRVSRRWLRAAGLVGLAGLTAASLSACSIVGLAQNLLGGGAQPTGPKAEGPKSGGELRTADRPIGPASAWLDPSYVDGIGENWATTDHLCGIDEATKIAVTWKNDVKAKRFSVIGTDLKTGKERWNVQNANCLRGAVRSGTAMIVRQESGGAFVQSRIDVATGQSKSETRTMPRAGRIAVTGESDRGATVLFFTDSERRSTRGVIDPSGKVLWHQVNTKNSDTFNCFTLKEVIGCYELDGLNRMYEEETGKLLSEVAEEEGGYFAFAYDGYGFRGADGVDMEFRDFSGKKIRSAGTRYAPVEPGLESGVSYTSASFTISPVLTGVDTQGNGVFGTEELLSDQMFFATKQPVEDLPLMRPKYVGVASDGSFMAYVPRSAASTVQLRKPDNTLIAEVPAGVEVTTPAMRGNAVLGGLLVITTNAGATVYLPKGF